MRAELIFSLTCLGLCSAVVSRQGPERQSWNELPQQLRGVTIGAAGDVHAGTASSSCDRFQAVATAIQGDINADRTFHPLLH
jgi:hypothetical protein